MNFSAISKQLVRDMKASLGKTVVLGILLLVGLYFWVPPLLKAFSDGAKSASAPTTSADNKSAVSRETTATTTEPNSSEPLKKSRDSQAIAKLFDEQSLWQPVSAEEMPPKPFGINDELLPLPVLIADDDLPALPKAAKPAPKPVDKLDGLVLKSTLVGPTRRVAIINNQLFREGQSVSWNDKQLRLESVTRKSVTLTDGSQSWQLTLKDVNGESDN